MTSDEKAIRDLMATWMRATLAGDTPTVLDLMSDDVVFMTPGRPPFGKAEFAASAASRPHKLEPAQEVLEVEVHGDLAFARTHLKVAVTPKPGASVVTLAGHTLSVFRKKDGRWRLARDSNFLVPVSV